MFIESGSLGEAIGAGAQTATMVFSGQDPDWTEGLRRTLRSRPELRNWAEETLAELAAILAADPTLHPELAAEGIDPANWLDGGTGWTAGQRAARHLCLMGSMLSHLVATAALAEDGFSHEAAGIRLASGHSAGLFSAWTVARFGSRPESSDAARALAGFAVIAAEMERQGDTVSDDVLTDLLAGEQVSSSMLMVAGPTEATLEKLVAGAGDTVRISLQNCFDRWVLTGRPAELVKLDSSLSDESGVSTEFVSSSCVYHNPLMEHFAGRATKRLQETGLAIDGDLLVELVDPRDGSRHRGGDLTERVVASMAAHRVRWADTMSSVALAGDVVIDVGPSTITAALCRRALKGSGAIVLAAGDPAQRRLLASGVEWPEPLVDYSRFRPEVLPAAVAGDGPRVRTRHTQRSGRSAVVLAGMTPTTVDAAIVSAAANAGHVAELAGGGQVSTSILSERLTELSELLTPGHEVVFNALHLDPYLWNLHLGRDRLVQRARANGAPICGVTVSAGIPDVDEAVALLDELNELGMWLNAFKPGDVAGVRRVLSIAQRSEHDIWLHLEGGLAGGHHSWQDLEAVLFATYADIREHDNVLLMVGGGIDSPSRSAELISGDWALRHGPRPMPVDGVLLGTVAMATAESTASRSVKQALVAAPGITGTVRPGEFDGGVTSGLSGLGADIHYLDNHASRLAHELDQVAGDQEAVARRHDDLAASLSRTAKPWFGELSRMTWAEVAGRFAELCALGRHGRYEDGRWLDATHRSKFLALLRRAEARCVPKDSGTFASVFSGPADLDDPGKAVELLVERYPLASSAVLTPTDVAAFIDICDSAGKPVPFVAVIDAQVRRRYLADSLWQSHSDLWESDQVLVIPGPSAVRGIDTVDEPVAELLGRFDSAVAEALGGPELLVAGDLLGEPESAIPAVPSAVESLIGCVGVSHGSSMVRSPLLSLAAPSQWELSCEGDRAIATLAMGEETATLEGPLAAEGAVTLTLTWPALEGVAGDGTMKLGFEVRKDHGVVLASLDGASMLDAQAAILDTLVAGANRTAGSRGTLVTSLTGSAEVPDSLMAFAWGPVFEALRGGDASNGLLRLVHARHRVRGALAEPDRGRDPGEVEVDAGLTGRVRVAAGEQLRTVASVAGMSITDDFIVRDGAGVTASVEEEEDTAQDPGEGWTETARSFLGRRVVNTPRNPEAFAVLSGDVNPIHRSDLVARLAGLPGRIVHGMWTSAAAQEFVVSELLGRDAARLTAWDISFVDMVEPGSTIVISASRTAVRDGARRVELRIEQAGRVVALAEADLRGPRTAYVFPGQGIQAKGMGLEALERSAAARGIWERADRYCRDELGFSVLEVVRDNPTRLQVGTDTHRHPAGVLHLTQFTQVAMATLAAAQVEELRDCGVLDPEAVIAGHSVGEYNALASAGGVLPLEAVLGIVWARGNAMHHLVPRSDDGSSQYRLGVVRPHHAGLGEDEASQLVAAVAADTGELCEIVNHNLRGRQYAVAGTVASLDELERRLGPGRSASKAPFLLVPGIDVPFHSRALADGVPEFRAHLDSALPTEIDPADLVGRYVPNLHPEPFSLDREYVEAVARTCGEGGCSSILSDWDSMVANPGRLTRELLVELLAWQFASPVRWIETTDVLLAGTAEGGLGVDRVIEVGMGASPTLTNLTRAAVAAGSGNGIEVLHVDSDRTQVFEETDAGEPPMPVLATAEEEPGEHDDQRGAGGGFGDDMDLDWDGDAPGPATGTNDAPSGGRAVAGAESVAASAGTPVNDTRAGDRASSDAAPSPAVAGTPAGEDRPVTPSDAIAALLAHLAAVRPDQLGDDSIDDLVDGASSRRNQVLMDLGKEFGIGSVEGAHEMPRSVLCDELAAMVKGHRHPGVVLQAAIASAMSSCLGPLGAGQSFVAKHLASEWQLGDGWAQQVELELLMGTRDGQSRRGGDLHTIEGADASSLVDAALASAADRLGVVVSKPVPEASGAMADAVELEALASRVGDAFRSAADAAAGSLGLAPVAEASDSERDGAAADRERLAVLDLEHGAERADEVAPSFDPARIRCFDSSRSWARADLDHLFHGLAGRRMDAPEAERLVSHLRLFAGSDARFDDTVGWYLGRAERAGAADAHAAFARIAEGPTAEQRRAHNRFAGRTVLVSGASPDSIGEATAAQLLAGSATVVMVSHSAGRSRRLAVRDLFRRHAGPEARLFLLRANLASFTDIDRLVDWLVQRSGSAAERPHPGLPDVVLPFAASAVSGDVPDTGHRSEVEMRILLLGVERLVGRLAEESGRAIGSERLTAVLPMSPNHGTFGGDGSYGDAKAGLEVLESRRLSEFERWGRHCRIVGAEIGWVRGTGLMSANDALAPLVEQQLGVRTYAPAEMGALIADLCAPEGAGGPGRAAEQYETTKAGAERVDLTGGLSEVATSGALSRLLRSGLSCASGLFGKPVESGADVDPDRELHALVTPHVRVGSGSAVDRAGTPAQGGGGTNGSCWPSRPQVAADDMVVICGTGEIGPWGSAATRRAAEHGELGGSGVVELAIRCGLLRWESTGSTGRYVDSGSDEPVEEHELVERYHDEVLDRCGIRPVTDGTFDQDIEVFLDRPVTVGVPDQSAAAAFASATEGATVTSDGDGWEVVLPTGSPIRMRRSAELPRGVTAAIPDGMTPEPFGVPVELAGSIDRMAAWNLAMTAEAFRDAGTDPEELLSVVHPSMVANTQGTGMGGLSSLRSLYVDPTTGTDHPNDLLQESLGNVPAAHAMQSFVGGYGSMIHPVGACASAAVSLEVAADLVALGKADVVLAGGFDDLAREGILGFADMSATADSAEMMAAGFEPSELSRPGDSDRAGFVESQGGGAMLVCRGSVARRLGLPVRAVLGLARSHSDGVQSSIPAPGLGALSIARGGKASPLAAALEAHGLGADDIAVVSKHDTSTRANDPNEAAIHERLAVELGRSPGNPLRVVSQKALTGHAKGGAAAWQVAGVCDIFETSIVPGNPNLDSPDPAVLDGPWLVADDRSLRLESPPRAALVTSLGFGHVSAALLLVHPEAFVAAMDAEERSMYCDLAACREEERDHLRRWELHGGRPAFVRPGGRRLAGSDGDSRKEAEMAALVDPEARMGPSGVFVGCEQQLVESKG